MDSSLRCKLANAIQMSSIFLYEDLFKLTKLREGGNNKNN